MIRNANTAVADERGTRRRDAASSTDDSSRRKYSWMILPILPATFQLTQWRVERATRLSHFLDKRARRRETRKATMGRHQVQPTMDATPLAATFHRKSELMCLIRTIRRNRRERASLAHNRYPLSSPRRENWCIDIREIRTKFNFFLFF